MNPQFNQTPGLHLPQPSNGGQQPGYNPAFMAVPQSPAAITPASPLTASPTPVQPSYQQPEYATQSQSPAQPTVAAIPTPMPADDGGGVVDDEWVNKARDIAARYKGDPYMQSKELSKLKSQYVKARYNKDVKVSEDRS